MKQSDRIFQLESDVACLKQHAAVIEKCSLELVVIYRGLIARANKTRDLAQAASSKDALEKQRLRAALVEIADNTPHLCTCVGLGCNCHVGIALGALNP